MLFLRHNARFNLRVELSGSFDFGRLITALTIYPQMYDLGDTIRGHIIKSLSLAIAVFSQKSPRGLKGWQTTYGLFSSGCSDLSFCRHRVFSCQLLPLLKCSTQSLRHTDTSCGTAIPCISQFDGKCLGLAPWGDWNEEAVCKLYGAAFEEDRSPDYLQ